MLTVICCQFPDANMVITEDTDWISVLNDVCYTILFLLAEKSLVYRVI